MQDASDFEKKFSQLLQQKDKTEAKEHLINAKPEELESMIRVSKCRAVVLLEGQTDDVKTVATYPKYLKLSKEGLMDTLTQLVESVKSTGTPTVSKAKKAKGTIPAPDSDAEPKKRGRPKGSKDKKERKKKGEAAQEAEGSSEPEVRKVTKRKRRGLKPGTPPEDGEEAETAPEAPKQEEVSEQAPAESVEQGAVQELLESIQTKVDEKLQEVDDKMGEVLINVNALTKQLGEVGGQEKQTREALERIGEFQKSFEVLYDHTTFIVEGVSYAGSLVADCNPEEFRNTVIELLNERAKEREKRMPNATKKAKKKKEDVAKSDEKSD